ncbi:MAG TPA: DUF1992 domain-containing protein [Gemmatimonadales bacterium]|nr:DUF1992 domain-containing protein [Gemmatimonadales bacterium]
MGIEDLIETRIRDAIAEGAFDNLRGTGQPLTFKQEEALAGENWLGYKVLQNGGLLPEWLMLAKEIEADREHLRRLDARHAEAVELAASSGDWAAHSFVIRQRRDAYEAAARALRKKQDRYNQDAPSPQLERPGIWVEHHLARLDARVAQSMLDTTGSC